MTFLASNQSKNYPLNMNIVLLFVLYGLILSMIFYENLATKLVFYSIFA